MSHSGFDPRAHEAFKAMQRKLEGEYPDGRLNPEDQGALAVGIAHQNGKVVMQFPKPTTWIGFTPEQAIEMAESLIDHARACGCTRPLEIKIG